MAMMTGFDPTVHGFGFTNRFTGSHVVGEFARQNRLEEILGFELPGPLTGALELASGEEFWGTFGLCGGMSWSSIDNYRAGRGSERVTAPPGPGTSQFEKLVARQADSLRGTSLVKRLVTWMALPLSNPWWAFWLDSVGKLVIDREWPALQAALDAGRPTSICLIRSRALDELGRNHQVVAIGYSAGLSGRVTVQLYDPNHPDATPEISFETRSFLHRLRIAQSTGETIHGWFVWDAHA